MSTIQEKIENGVVGKLLFDMKLISPMVSKELEYNARQLAKEILKYLDENNVVIRRPNGANLEGCCLVRLERLVEE